MAEAIRLSLCGDYRDRIIAGVSHIDPKTSCWVWGKSKNAGGYGYIKLAGKRWLANRASWAAFYGDIPAGLCVLHRCDNPSCVNPTHLFLGTNADNVADSTAKGRRARNSYPGSANPMSVLTEDDVREIRRLSGSVPRSSLSRRFNVSMPHLSYIINRRRWKHVTDEGDDSGK